MGRTIKITDSEMIDRKFDKLTVLKAVGKHYKSNQMLFECRCECGNIAHTTKQSLVSLSTKSCGCIPRGPHGANRRKRTEEEKSLASHWRGMKDRVTNKNNKCYKNYGGRGISISDEWLNSFDCFYSDMGLPPFKGAHLDRIDNDGNYCKENCRWVTNAQNGMNRRGMSNASSKYKGVSYQPQSKNKWRACICKDGNNIVIGFFENEDEAGLAYNEKAKELFGEYAYLNKISSVLDNQI